MMKKTLFFALLICVSVAHAQVATLLVNNEASVLQPYISQYQADKNMLNRKYALKQSEEYYLRMELFYADWQRQLKSLSFAKLSQNEKVDYILLKRDIGADARNLQTAFAEFKESNFLLPFAALITDFEQKRRVGKQQDGATTAATFGQLKLQLSTVKSAVERKDITVNVMQAKWAQQALAQYAATFTEAYKFYDGYDPQFTKATKVAYAEVLAAFKAYNDVLAKMEKQASASDDGSGIVGNPIGRAALVDGLQDEMIAYTPEQLTAIAQREFAWCDAEVAKAAREMGFGNDWKAALEKVKTAYPPLGKQPELVFELANEAIDFVEKNKLITVPFMAKEGWRMRMLTPEEQRFAPFFLGGESVLIAYPHESMSEEAKMMTLRGNNRHFSRAVVFHELIPGHNLQYYMQSRYKPYRRAFSTPFWTEGWSLYWEMLLWDNNFAKSPEDKLGMLFWRMHRCARIIFSTKYHLGKWTPKQCIDFLVERVGFERANAEAEVRRSFTGNYGPLYQIGYMLGGLQFRALQKELVQTGKMNNIDFHDRILKENCMPVEMVRALLTNQALTEDFTTKWKFAGEVE
ncbi:DUF885 family protein [Pedobacter sp. SL55]|uniref:DUF885 family protein n=1 Tax=Pedobacter sp. SL55 TaxID=2995161 RepID=UPI00226D8D84|nr:DUF885 family protein [Pedobacter sp. SL55]WAC42290.1 DUF885 family protein [Pedobacter sp. SL55]